MNGLFLLMAMLMCAVALGFVIYPLLRTPQDEPGRVHQSINLAVHRDRMRELAQDLTAQTLTRSQYDTAVADLERELLDSGGIALETALETAHATTQAPAQSRQWMALAAACASVALLPFMAIGIYLAVGHAEEVFAVSLPDTVSMPDGAMPPMAQTASSEVLLESEFQHLAQQLQGRLAQSPDDMDSWILLGRTLTFLNDLEAAGRAYREAMVHGGEHSPELLTRYADVLAEQQGTLAGEPRRLIEQALAIDPYHPQGLWLAGSRAFLDGEMDAAGSYWERLLSVIPEDSPEAEVIRGNLMQALQAQPEG